MKHRGVPDHLVFLAREFYEGKCAQVAEEGMLSDKFFMQTGLGQVPSSASSVQWFNVFLAAVMESWENKRPNKIPPTALTEYCRICNGHLCKTTRDDLQLTGTLLGLGIIYVCCRT